MTELTQVQEALLELGLMDLIWLHETISEPVVLEARSERPVEVVMPALVGLLKNDFIQVFSGHWQNEPTLVNRETAKALLLDEKNYFFDLATDSGERVYYVNVENYREDYPE